MTSEGLSLFCNVPINGRVATLRLVRPSNIPNNSPCNLVVTTERCQFMVLRWDEKSQTVVTVAVGDLRVRQPALPRFPSPPPHLPANNTYTFF